MCIIIYLFNLFNIILYTVSRIFKATIAKMLRWISQFIKGWHLFMHYGNSRVIESHNTIYAKIAFLKCNNSQQITTHLTLSHLPPYHISIVYRAHSVLHLHAVMPAMKYFANCRETRENHDDFDHIMCWEESKRMADHSFAKANNNFLIIHFVSTWSFDVHSSKESPCWKLKFNEQDRTCRSYRADRTFRRR